MDPCHCYTRVQDRLSQILFDVRSCLSSLSALDNSTVLYQICNMVRPGKKNLLDQRKCKQKVKYARLSTAAGRVRCVNTESILPCKCNSRQSMPFTLKSGPSLFLFCDNFFLPYITMRKWTRYTLFELRLRITTESKHVQRFTYLPK